MADYKVIDAEQLDADLLSVADKIREKAETTGEMAFPGEFISALDALGGGLPARITAIEFGEYVPTSDISVAPSIAHGLGVNPNLVLFGADGAVDMDGYFVMQAGATFAYGTGAALTRDSSKTTGYAGTTFYGGNGYANATIFKPECGSSRKLKSGARYFWVVGVIDYST